MMAETYEERAQIAEARLSKLGDLFYEIERRARKEHADAGNDFTVTIDFEMWKSIKEYI